MQDIMMKVLRRYLVLLIINMENFEIVNNIIIEIKECSMKYQRKKLKSKQSVLKQDDKLFRVEQAPKRYRRTKKKCINNCVILIKKEGENDQIVIKQSIKTTFITKLGLMHRKARETQEKIDKGIEKTYNKAPDQKKENQAKNNQMAMENEIHQKQVSKQIKTNTQEIYMTPIMYYFYYPQPL